MQTRTSRQAPRPRRLARTTLLVAAGTTALAVLTGCSSGSDDSKSGDKNVASLPTQGKSGSAAKPGSTADPDAGRPQIRLDSTQDDINKMMTGWTSCLEQRGGPNALFQYKMALKDKKTTPAGEACQSKLPLDPPELDPDKNPNYTDDVRAMVQCMNSKGIKSEVDTKNGGWALTSGDEMGAPGFEEAKNTCQVKAFGGNK